MFVAITHSGPTCRSVSRRTTLFTSIFSTIASTTTSEPESPWNSTPPEILSMCRAASRLDILRRFTASSKMERACCSPPLTAS